MKPEGVYSPLKSNGKVIEHALSVCIEVSRPFHTHVLPSSLLATRSYTSSIPP